MQPKPYHCLPGAGRQLSAMGIQIEIKVPSNATEGKWSMLEYTAPAHYDGPPPHVHKILYETFYVVEGTLTLLAGSETVEATAGTVLVVPPGTVHKFSNRSDAPVRFMLLMNPGGFENYFAEVISLRKAEPQWPPADPAKMLALMERFDTYAP